MTNIQERIEIINSLLLKGTPQYITYAALECRLTIESIVYDRSKLSLDKMSQSEVPVSLRHHSVTSRILGIA